MLMTLARHGVHPEAPVDQRYPVRGLPERTELVLAPRFRMFQHGHAHRIASPVGECFPSVRCSALSVREQSAQQWSQSILTSDQRKANTLPAAHRTAA